MNEVPGAIDMTGYSGQWVAQRPSAGRPERAEVVASAFEYYELMQELQKLGIDKHQVGVWKIPTADNLLIL
ncbi:MAG: hypothetical protein ACREP9_11120 [Candidatus Dormibacteraceae bacterium]